MDSIELIKTQSENVFQTLMGCVLILDQSSLRDMACTPQYFSVNFVQRGSLGKQFILRTGMQ